MEITLNALPAIPTTMSVTWASLPLHLTTRSSERTVIIAVQTIFVGLTTTRNTNEALALDRS